MYLYGDSEGEGDDDSSSSNHNYFDESETHNRTTN